MNTETYWNYTIKSKGETIQCVDGKIEIVDEMEDIQNYDINDIGKYSSLESAIKGFINESLNSFSKIKIEFFDEEHLKFKLTSEVYYDRFGQPINDVIYRRWQRGEYKLLKHCFIEAIFIEHMNRQGTINDYSEIMRKFPDIEISE